MFSIIWSKKKSSSSSCKDEGLRLILKKLATANSKYVLVKPILVVVDCYLKSCHLCRKPLPLGKEIYMYRGDLGFCSVNCRDSQIYLDETKELEISTKKILLSVRQGIHQSRSGARCETYRRKPRHSFSSGKNELFFFCNSSIEEMVV